MPALRKRWRRLTGRLRTAWRCRRVRNRRRSCEDQQVEDHADKTVGARHPPILAASEPALLGPAKPQVTAPGRVFGTHRTARARRGAVTTTECTPEWIEVYLSEF